MFAESLKVLKKPATRENKNATLKKLATRYSVIGEKKLTSYNKVDNSLKVCCVM